MARIYRYILKTKSLPVMQIFGAAEKHLFFGLLSAAVLFSLPTFGSLLRLWESNKAFDGLLLVPFMTILLFHKSKMDLTLQKVNLNVSAALYALVSIVFMVILNANGFIRLSGYCFIVSLFFIFILGFGFETRKCWLGSLFFLGLMVPVSLNVLNIGVYCLQHFFSWIIEIVSPVFSAELLARDGFDFYFENCPHQMTIAPECSGFQSLTGFVIMITFFAVMDRHDKLSLGLLFTVGILSALVLNFLRIAITIQLRLTGLEEYSIGRWHGFLGIIVFIAGCLFLSKFSKFLRD